MEEKEFLEKWTEKAKDIQEISELPNLLENMLKDANDYGSIARCIGLGAVAAAKAMDRSEMGGITGFQAGFVMWTFIREWMYFNNKCGLKIVDYDNMLYPQYDCKFEKTINSDIWKGIQRQAKINLENIDDYTHINVINHWKSIVNGVVPFGYRIVED